MFHFIMLGEGSGRVVAERDLTCAGPAPTMYLCGAC